MAAITHVRTIDDVARMLDEDVERLEAIISNDDIIDVYISPDKTLTILTDDGIEKLTDVIQTARINTKTWHTFLDEFAHDADLVTQIKAKSPR